MTAPPGRFPGPPEPRGVDRFSFEDHLGDLVAIRGDQFEAQFPGTGQYGPRDTVFSTIEVISGVGPGSRYERAWVQGQIVVDQLKEVMGQLIYVRIGQRGRAWVLDPIKHGDEALIDAWIASKRQPAQATPPAANGNVPPVRMDQAVDAERQAYEAWKASQPPAAPLPPTAPPVPQPAAAPAQPAGYDDPPPF